MAITRDINFRPKDDDKKIRNGNVVNSRSVSRASVTTVSSRPQSRSSKTIKRQSSIDLSPSPRKPEQPKDRTNSGKLMIIQGVSKNRNWLKHGYLVWDTL